MADKKLESFKIGDSHRTGLSAPAQKAGAKGGAEKPGSPSVGFARIEGILEAETPETVGQAMGALQKSLEDLGTGGGNKEKAAAKKALLAIDRAVDLMEYLFQTKASLESETQNAAKRPKG